MASVWRIWSEWDLGIDELYSTKKVAWAALKQAMDQQQEENGLDTGFEEAKDFGLIGVEEVTVSG